MGKPQNPAELNSFNFAQFVRVIQKQNVLLVEDQVAPVVVEHQHERDQRNREDDDVAEDGLGPVLGIHLLEDSFGGGGNCGRILGLLVQSVLANQA